MSLLLAKIVFSVVVVLGLSWIAERVNPRIAGIISGMPLGAVLALFFVGMELGPEFTAVSALYAIPSITSTLAFAIGYYFTSRLDIRYSPLCCSVTGLICYLLFSFALSTIEFDLFIGVPLVLAAIIIVAYAFHSHNPNKIQKKIRMTWPRMLIRSGMAAGFVVVITTIADVLGPRWSGLMLGFPMTFLPFLLIIHLTYSANQVRTIIRNFPLGIIGLLCFLIIAHLTIPLFGVNLAIVISMAGALVYLSLLGVTLSRLKPAPAQ